YDYVKSKSVTGHMNYLFIDEIQAIESFELALRSLVAERGYDIYCTGSNAKLLSGELATWLGGRYIEIPIYPLTYNEFLLFHQLHNSSDTLNLYLRYGGLPYLKNLELNDEVVFDYLRNIYQAILFRDVVARHHLRNVEFLERLILYLANHSGSLVSANNISKYLKSQGINVAVSVVLAYLDYLAAAFFVSKVKRSDIRGKKIFESGEKYYFTDIGLRNSIAGYSAFDMGLIIENSVFNHLLSSAYRVRVGKSGDKEIDFIAEKDNEKIYLQVALRITDESTRDREFGNLQEISDNYPKMLITMDEYTGPSHEGIRHIPLREFLTTTDW
ncbi:MAG: ATP-binding protein, partial [Bacteroidota bacterium]|nr:ATP-binding protein [Bacteroidota bacterium]